jgi:hypothetical protein
VCKFYPILIFIPEIYVGYPVFLSEIQLRPTSYICVIGRDILLDSDFDFSGMRKTYNLRFEG